MGGATGKTEEELNKMTMEEKKEEFGKNMDNETMIKMSAAGIDVMWSMTVYDTEKALRASCEKVFGDKSVEKRERALRAQGIMRLGNIMKKYGDNTGQGLKELKNQAVTQVAAA